MINFALLEALLLFAYLGKFLYFTPNYSEAILVVLLTGIHLATKYYNENKKIVSFQQEIQKQSEDFKRLEKEFNNLSNHVSSLKINQIRTTTVMGNK